ncbi:MAG: hypothetical protein K6A65_09525 [Succinivibrionaceae bacterium]|nr:hypothetical protein [Succinivibrionaceae bacterium]
MEGTIITLLGGGRAGEAEAGGRRYRFADAPAPLTLGQAVTLGDESAPSALGPGHARILATGAAPLPRRKGGIIITNEESPAGLSVLEQERRVRLGAEGGDLGELWELLAAELRRRHANALLGATLEVDRQRLGPHCLYRIQGTMAQVQGEGLSPGPGIHLDPDLSRARPNLPHAAQRRYARVLLGCLLAIALPILLRLHDLGTLPSWGVTGTLGAALLLLAVLGGIRNFPLRPCVFTLRLRRL